MGRVDYREFYHYGVKRRSGRYPWGSGDRPYQRDSSGQYKLNKYTSPSGFKVKEYSKAFMKTALIIRPMQLGLLFLGVPVPVINTITISSRLGSYGIGKANASNIQDKRPIEPLKELKKKGEEIDPKQDLKAVNPLKNKPGGNSNCVNCVAAMEMRKRGYDVEARLSSAKKSYEEYAKDFKGFKYEQAGVKRNEKESRKDYINRSYDELLTKLEKNGNGSRGVLAINFDKSLSQSVGHVLYWENVNGKVILYDPQGGNAEKAFSLSDPTSLRYGRFDNLKVTNDISNSVVSKKRR